MDDEPGTDPQPITRPVGGGPEHSEEGELAGMRVAVALYVVILLLKLAVYAATGVFALFAEALHTFSDIIISVFLLVAARYARREPDEMHMFGHGRAQSVAALVAATLFISFTALHLYEEAIPRILSGEVTGSYGDLRLAAGVLVVSMALAAVPLVLLRRGGAHRSSGGAAAKAQALELVNDELGLVAALIGTVLVATGEPIGDPVAAVVVATVIVVNAVGLLRENAAYLVGRSPGAAYTAEIERAARSVPGVLDVHEVRVEFVGPGIVRAGLHVGVAPDTTVEEADRIRREVRDRIDAGQRPNYCFIQVQAARRAAGAGDLPG
jgi:cation diffusion facilitator family transporter